MPDLSNKRRQASSQSQEDPTIAEARIGDAILSVPIDQRKFRRHEPTDIPGFGKRQGELHVYVPQGHAGFTFDIPLVSDGFGPCWAAIMHDGNTGKTVMLHVDDFEAKENQRLKIERNMPVGSGINDSREAVIVHGSRTHASEQSKEYFYGIGCSRVRIITADSKEYHWGIAFSPNANVFDVVTKSPEGCTATRYQAFSNRVYDSEARRDQSLEERKLENSYRALDFLRWSDKRWLTMNGHYSPQGFSEFTDAARALWPNLAPADSVRDLLLAHHYAYLCGDTLVIPRFLHWLEPEESEPYYGLKKGVKAFATIRVFDTEDFHDFRTKIAASLSGTATKHLDTNFLLLESAAGKVLFHFSSDEITIYELTKGDLLRTTMNALSAVAEANSYRFEYSSGGSSLIDRIPFMTPERWAQMEARRAEYEEIMGRACRRHG